MFSYLLSLSLSYFIPPEIGTTIALHSIPLEDAFALSKNYSIVVGLVLPKNSSELATEFSAFSTLYNNSVYFTMLKAKSVRRKLGTSTPAKAILVIIKNETIIEYCGNIDSNRYLAYMIEEFLEPKHTLIIDQDSLQSEIGKGKMTILTTGYNRKIAHQVWHSLVRSYGPVSLEFMTDDVARGIGISPQDFAYYRISDYELDAVKMGSDIAKKSDSQKVDYVKNQILNALRNPTYKTLTMREIVHSDKPIVTFLVQRATEDHLAFLNELGKYFRDFEFGILDPNAFGEVYGFVEGDKTHDNIAIFSIKHQYTYNLSKFYKTVPVDNFSVSTWIQPFVNFISEIRNNKLQPNYKSENENEIDPEKIFVKLCSTNYHEYLNNNTDIDVVMLYVRKNCKACSLGFRQLKQFIEMNEMANITSVKFAFIDVSRNGVKGGYPQRYVDPHFVLFPKGRKNNENPVPMFGIHTFEDFFQILPIYATNFTMYGKPKYPGDKTYNEIEDALNYSFTKVPFHTHLAAKKSLKTMLDLKVVNETKAN